ncbi:Gfo/Idh/MocA family oxidoreductase [Prochlorococcus marinus XMU1411]|uniref:Gfo/Idh/MocA family oxidoreductase n=1 Tax=Prochlorococcus marinus TaxID=1219 RepID=UPI001ADA9C80|nr:Gfo/Idh/MocA family oxidoreductase [Prochlorococcus marinus]MBO8244207.1 Gfo/Idh/MocA family oxidoreductase [Prochlorococcus marinus XMU1411]MBW3055292.1 oxidoreductase [Prochlorococcus marinus str. MU1411]MCR8537035.1 Gfo/Idh/MocA family oxidoreductase [Prochlorococcus marinus CUG1430]
MKQILIRNGKPDLFEVPFPAINNNEILVKLHYSALSPGTEIKSIGSTADSLLVKAVKDPKKIITGFKLLKEKGFALTNEIISQKEFDYLPIGYSAAGEIIALGKNVTSFSLGDKVACAGAKYAYHSEYICIPEKLCVLVPNGLSLEKASTVTLGAIALQGVRRANLTLGENVLVLGLGILGQLTSQLLRSNGCNVFGLDLDKKRVNLAKSLGLKEGFLNDKEIENKILKITNGYGVDCVIITASTNSDSVVSTAFRCCRKKARVILVGDVGLKLNRDDIYSKEIDFLVSTSYGPGRYDQRYEEEGLDYPLPYIRWTENRNMQEYLRLINEGNLSVDEFISNKFSLDKFEEAYASLQSEEKKVLAVLEYPNRLKSENLISNSINIKKHNIFKKNNKKINIGIIGCGNFTRSVHLPNLKKLKNLYSIDSIVNKNGFTSLSIAEQFSIKNICNNFEEIINNPNIDAVLISTRHDLHSEIVIESLKAGKHVFVEKPLSISQLQLDKIKLFLNKNSENQILMTGYNRRFSIYFEKLKNIRKKSLNPFIFNYKVNAGFINLDNWVHKDEGGGRNIGEACHFYDIFNFLADSEIECFSAHSINIQPTLNNSFGLYTNTDNFVATFKYKNGSICNLIFTALGNNKFPKESFDFFQDGEVVSMEDFRKMSFYEKRRNNFSTKNNEKGHLEELKAFANGIKMGKYPISLNDQIKACQISLDINDLIT